MKPICRATCAFSLLLLLGFYQAPTGQAERAEQIFKELSKSSETGREHTLLEEDLNAYIARELSQQSLRGIEEFRVKLNQGTFTSFLRVNLDEVEVSGYLQYLGSLTEGPQRLTVEGRLQVRDGIGTYKTESAWLNDIPLPASLVDVLLSSLGRQQEPPFDPTEPFDAPYGITHLEIEPGKAVLTK